MKSSWIDRHMHLVAQLLAQDVFAGRFQRSGLHKAEQGRLVSWALRKSRSDVVLIAGGHLELSKVDVGGSLFLVSRPASPFVRSMIEDDRCGFAALFLYVVNAPGDRTALQLAVKQSRSSSGDNASFRSASRQA